MREILFRGKRVDNNQWTEGFLSFIYTDGRNSNGFIYTDKAQIYSPVEVRSHDVYTATVGQFTGLYDKNGKKIFEGDVMQLCSATYPCTVYWDGIGWAWKMNGKRRDIDLTREKMAVIGNIHDTPDLAKEKSV